MAAPTEAELKLALTEATRMREGNADPHFLAKALLSLNYRLELLDQVKDAAKHFLHSGLAPHEHTVLVKAIERAESAAEPLGTEHESFGLEPEQ